MSWHCLFLLGKWHSEIKTRLRFSQENSGNPQDEISHGSQTEKKLLGALNDFFFKASQQNETQVPDELIMKFIKNSSMYFAVSLSK